MIARRIPPDPNDWALKLRDAAAELRLKASRSPDTLNLARRLDRYAEVIMCPQLPRWWPELREVQQVLSASGDD